MNERRATQDQDSMLNVYMKDVARHPLLSPDEERELGRTLIQCRVQYWKSVLSYAPYTAAAVSVLSARMASEPSLVSLLEEAARSARAARDTNRRASADRFERAVQSLAQTLAVADSECLGADLIAADLESLATGSSEGLSMDVRPPREGSQRFADYLARVRKASTALRVIRNRFAQANLRLVVRIAHRFQRTGLTLHDRVQEGNIGLMKAVDRFDPSRGFRFSTYASWWIKHAIRRAVVNRGRTIRLPAHLQATAQKVVTARTKLRSMFSEEPSSAQIAAELDLPVDKVELVLEAIGQRAVSLDARVSDDDERTVVDLLMDEDALLPDEQLELTWDSQIVRGQLDSLSPLEQDILKQRFGLDGGDERTLTEIGGQYALSRERIRQLQQKALQRLKVGLDASASM